MTEGLINHFGKGNFQAFSAGSNPAGYVHPMSIKTLEKSGIFKTDYKSQSWDEFSDIDFDLVITVCNNASSEACPIYLSNAPKVHWGVEIQLSLRVAKQKLKMNFSGSLQFLRNEPTQWLKNITIQKRSN